MNIFFTAIGFLTRIPVNIKENLDNHTLSQSIIFFPLVGVLIGALNGGAYFALVPFLPISVVAVILILIPIIITGGLHFDGLMDACDGLFSGRPAEQILEIMRDSRVGSMGVIAGITNVLLRYSILIALPLKSWPIILIMAYVASRWVMSLALHFYPYARKEGKGAGFNAEKSWINIFLSTLMTGVIIFGIGRTAGLVTLLAVGLLTTALASWINKKIGGLTGDVYGALNEVAEISFLLVSL